MLIHDPQTRAYSRPLTVLALALALTSASAVAQSPTADDPGLPATSDLPPLNTLATFEDPSGSKFFFGAGDHDDDLIFIEIGAKGKGLAFPPSKQGSLLDRYLAIAPRHAHVPRALVDNDPEGFAKIGHREIVEAAGPFQLDLPLHDGGSQWGCGSRDTRANFEAQFCTGTYAGSDVLDFCDSGTWWDLIRSRHRQQVATVTAYCGDELTIGFGAVTFLNRWDAGAADWLIEHLAAVGPDVALGMVWFTGSSSWKQARHTVMQSSGIYLGSLRGLTVFSNEP